MNHDVSGVSLKRIIRRFGSMPPSFLVSSSMGRKRSRKFTARSEPGTLVTSFMSHGIHPMVRCAMGRRSLPTNEPRPWRKWWCRNSAL